MSGFKEYLKNEHEHSDEKIEKMLKVNAPKVSKDRLDKFVTCSMCTLEWGRKSHLKRHLTSKHKLLDEEAESEVNKILGIEEESESDEDNRDEEEENVEEGSSRDLGDEIHEEENKVSDQVSGFLNPLSDHEDYNDEEIIME